MLLTKGTSPLLQRERSTLKALPKMTEIQKPHFMLGPSLPSVASMLHKLKESYLVTVKPPSLLSLATGRTVPTLMQEESGGRRQDLQVTRPFSPYHGRWLKYQLVRIVVTLVVSLRIVANVVHVAHVVVQGTALETVKRLIGCNTNRFASKC